MATSRRAFLRGLTAAAALGACRSKSSTTTTTGASATTPPGRGPAAIARAPIPMKGNVPRRALGATGVDVSILGVGGFHLGIVKDLDEAKRIVHEALDAGVTFFDNAWEYNDGKSEDWLGKALAGKRQQAFVMTKVCTHGRDAKVAMQQLDDSLRRLGTDYLDLWQIHECIYDTDPDLHFAKDGVVRALEDAKRQGKVRFVGFTGHKHPRIHLAMMARGFAFDTVQLPLNAFDASFRSFEREVVPEARRRRLGVIGMKTFGGEGRPILEGVVTADEALRYAMSIPGVAVTVTGIDSIEILRQNLAIAGGFEPMSEAEMQALRRRCEPHARDGHFELYKTTLHFDAKVGRGQHGYPSDEEVPL